MQRKKGFTLAELLIVVAIIAVLVAVSIPIFATQLHKARVATDWANVRSYFSEIQADYISTGKYNSKVSVDWSTNPKYNWDSITFLNGTNITLETGKYAVTFADGEGYNVVYRCNDNHEACELDLGL